MSFQHFTGFSYSHVGALLLALTLGGFIIISVSSLVAVPTLSTGSWEFLQ